MVSINLLDNHRKKVVKRHSQAKRVNKSVGIALAAMSLVTGSLFAGNFWMKSRLSKIEEKIAVAEAELSSFSEAKIEIFKALARLQAIDQIFMARQAQDKKLAVFFDLYESSEDIRQVNFGGGSDALAMEVRGTSESLARFFELNQLVLDLTEREGVDTLYLSSLSENEVSEFSFGYLIGFSGNTKNEK